MTQFDDAGTYFDLGPKQMPQAGIFHYMCTRNNAFSNRSQKGKLVVSAVSLNTNAIGVNGGTVMAAGAQAAVVAPGAFTSLQTVTIAVTPRSAMSTVTTSNQAGDFVEVDFDSSSLAPGESVQVTINYENSPLHNQKVQRASSLTSGDWQTISADSISGGVARISTTQPGVFTVQSNLNGGAVAGIVIGCLVFIGIVGFILFKVYKRKQGSNLPSTAARMGTELNTVPNPAVVPPGGASQA